jgi:hypothetical protein
VDTELGVNDVTVHVEQPEETVDDYDYNAYERTLLAVQHSLASFYKRHSKVIWTCVGIVLLLAYFVYLGLAINYR